MLSLLSLLSAELGMCIEFPIEAMPEVVRPMITQGATAIQCPPDFIAVPLLACLGAAIGRTRVIEVKPGWRESTLLWTVVVGRPGTAKSPAFELATQPLRQIQERLMSGIGDANRSIVKVHMSSQSNRLIVTDTTVEALAVVMGKNPRGLILLRDELAGWMNSMNQYKRHGNDEQFYLATWSGESHVIDRKSLDEPICIPNTYLAVAGCVQPGVLEKLLTKERHDEGFASRLLLSYPAKVNRQWTDAGTEDQVVAPTVQLFKKLYGLKFENGKPAVVHFTKDGYEAFRTVMNDHLQQTDYAQQEDHIAAHWAKMEGYFARLCLTIHTTRYCAGGTRSEHVDAESVYMAATLVDYFKAHVLRFYKILDTKQPLSKSQRIVNWAKRHNKTEVSIREILTARIADNKEEAIAVFDQMQEDGLGHWKDDGDRREFVLDPTQHSATQQSQQESKWLGKLRGLQAKKI